MEQEPAARLVEFSNILCAIDLGPQSADVLKCASQLAADLHTQLGIVHAVPTPSPGLELLFEGDWKAEVANMARQDIEKLLGGKNGASAATVHIQEGEAAKAVCAVAREAEADLLVIGRGPRDRMDGRLTTHSYAIIRQSPCPVLSI